MNGVIGMTGVLLDTELTDEQREYAEIVRKSGENLLNLINDILDFSKIEAGKMDMEILDFDMRATIEDTAEMLAVRAADAGLELICLIDAGMPVELKGDPGRVRQIITNLAGNAIKFTHHGEVVISAELQSEQEGMVTILFKISDTGIGIPEDRIQAIFTPFAQADGSTTRKYGGTGLGLTICKQLVELMGGEIGVESKDSNGSTFWFTLRFEKQAVSHSTQSAEIRRGLDTAARKDFATARFLVVDDNATNRRLLTTLLSKWGCRHEMAEDAHTALSLLHKAAQDQDPFRIALIDQMMPEMDGRELGRRIKTDPVLGKTMMIMLTSLGQRGDANALARIGFAGYLAKPIRQSQLHDCITLVMARALEPETAGDATEDTRGIVTRHTVAESIRHGVRILLAEDNIINQKVAQNILNRLGYKADVVADGKEAIKALELINYDLVLMDCQMPHMDGFEATSIIRDASSRVCNHQVPIVALTANAMKGDKEKCLASGMDDYLSKPVKKENMSDVLVKWLPSGSEPTAKQDLNP